MRLRTQLLFVALLTLALPWAGCQYVREMEGILREGQEDALLATAQAISHVVGKEPATLYRHSIHIEQMGDTALDVYAHQLKQEISVDGFADDWREYAQEYITESMRSPRDPFPILGPEAGRLRYVAGVGAQHLYLFMYIEDEDKVRYFSPDRNNPALGDHVVLHTRIDLESPAQRYWLMSAAPGNLVARRGGGLFPDSQQTESSIRANWQPHPRGYQLEVAIPLALLGAEFGFSVMDMELDERGVEVLAGWSGTVLPQYQQTLGFLIYPPPELKTLLEPYQQAGLKLRVTDRSGRLLADLGNVTMEEQYPDYFSRRNEIHLQDIYRAIIDTLPRKKLVYLEHSGRLHGTFIGAALSGRKQVIWRRQADASKAIITAVHPIENEGKLLGAVILEQSSDAVLSLTNKAIKHLFNTTFGALAIATLGMFGFATMLSLRIRRLRDFTERSVTVDGVIHAHLIPTGASDELGDLSRSFAGLLRRLDDYNNYLQTLASKLSHELRTPLAVVSSSLENLEQESLPDRARTYSRRAREGTERLRAILTSLSEATRVEQSIQAADPEQFDLREVMQGIVQGYTSVYTRHIFRVHTPDQPCPMLGSPELIAQMLDKLVDNAADFCPPGGLIDLRLGHLKREYIIAVSNEGPTLPRKMQEQLFDQLVSVREKRGESPHLGLGLYIAKLIAEHHGGTIQARNLTDETGVEFRILIPAVE